MSETVLLDQFRKKLASHMAGKNTLKPLAQMAMGDGGHTLDTHLATEVDATATELNNELLRKPLEVLDKEDDYSSFGQITLEKEDLVDQDISERALVDSDGDLVALNHCRPKHKESDEKYIFIGTMRF